MERIKINNLAKIEFVETVSFDCVQYCTVL